ncbi:DUF5362 family protein [Prosthecobacter sp.]|jgi:hypothetical protein|uniref:DUF5362 family protein n=1 Tax=Prosthecobacter sp. TaxID=1965333 RepID=UPI0037C55801
MESPLSNPYSSPVANLFGSATNSAAEAVSPSTIAQLAGTKPWVRFMSVIFWLGGLFLVLLSGFYALLAASGTFNNDFKSNPAIAGNPVFTNNPAFLAGILIGTSIYLGVFAFLTIYPALKLWKYANSIGRLMASRSIADLDAALTEQRRYWKFHGIMTLIAICMVLIGVIAFFALIFTAISSGMKFPR